MLLKMKEPGWCLPGCAFESRAMLFECVNPSSNATALLLACAGEGPWCIHRGYFACPALARLSGSRLLAPRVNARPRHFFFTSLTRSERCPATELGVCRVVVVQATFAQLSSLWLITCCRLVDQPFVPALQFNAADHQRM